MTFYPMDIELIIILLLGFMSSIIILVAYMLHYMRLERKDDKRSDERAKRIVAVAYGNRSRE